MLLRVHLHLVFNYIFNRIEMIIMRIINQYIIFLESTITTMMSMIEYNVIRTTCVLLAKFA